MWESGVSRQLPTTALWAVEFGAASRHRITLPGPLREAPSRHPQSSLPNVLQGTANG
jgi:hypothetical protein